MNWLAFFLTRNVLLQIRLQKHKLLDYLFNIE